MAFFAVIHALLRLINEEIAIGTSERNEYESKQCGQRLEK